MNNFWTDFDAPETAGPSAEEKAQREAQTKRWADYVAKHGHAPSWAIVDLDSYDVETRELEK